MTEEIKKRWRRFQEPDGDCSWCHKAAEHRSPIGPIRITISEPTAQKVWTFEFCTWECLGYWVAFESGGWFEVGSPTLNLTGFEDPETLHLKRVLEYTAKWSHDDDHHIELLTNALVVLFKMQGVTKKRALGTVEKFFDECFDTLRPPVTHQGEVKH